MVKVALVGYRNTMYAGPGGDLIELLEVAFKHFEGVELCHLSGVDDRPDDVGKLVDEMLAANPDVLHYANFRDFYGGDFDTRYIEEVKRRTNIPILLTSGRPEAEPAAAELGVVFMPVPFKMSEYEDTLKELAVEHIVKEEFGKMPRLGHEEDKIFIQANGVYRVNYYSARDGGTSYIFLFNLSELRVVDFKPKTGYHLLMTVASQGNGYGRDLVEAAERVFKRLKLVAAELDISDLRIHMPDESFWNHMGYRRGVKRLNS